MALLGAESAILDGEVVAIDEGGRPSFQALHHQSAHTLVYYVFDVLHLDGSDLTATPLDERRDLLARVLNGSRLLRSEPLPARPHRSRRPFASFTSKASSRNAGTPATNRASAVVRG